MIAANRVQRSLKVSFEIQKLQVSVLMYRRRRTTRVTGEATAMLDTVEDKTGQQVHWRGYIIPSESGRISFIHYSFLFGSLKSIVKLGFGSELESTF